MNREIELLLGLLDEAFDKKAWHGPNLRGAVRGVAADEAAWRPSPDRHNVWEIAVTRTSRSSEASRPTTSTTRARPSS